MPLMRRLVCLLAWSGFDPRSALSSRSCFGLRRAANHGEKIHGTRCAGAPDAACTIVRQRCRPRRRLSASTTVLSKWRASDSCETSSVASVSLRSQLHLPGAAVVSCLAVHMLAKHSLSVDH